MTIVYITKDEAGVRKLRELYGEKHKIRSIPAGGRIDFSASRIVIAEELAPIDVMLLIYERREKHHVPILVAYSPETIERIPHSPLHNLYVVEKSALVEKLEELLR